ncbi:MAG: FecR domain-containing protein, partial [Acidobacteriia bacterium]|nr:FecR domain-containing protein [Terriglobia bacterium]
MCRSLISLVLAFALTVFGSPVEAQFATAPQDSASAQSPQPQAQYQQPQYPQTQQGYSNNPQSYSQPDEAQPDPAMDRQHAVARLSIVQGDVNVKLGSTGELVAAAMNAPMVAQDHLQTSPGSRAEVELDSANLVRLGPNTDLGFADLEYHRYQVQLGAGAIIYRVLRDSNAQAEIDTPSIAVHPQQRGEYRISVLDDGTTQITVRSGSAEIVSPHGSEQLQPGQTTLVRGNPSDPEFQTSSEIARDQLDDWSAGRDRDLLASQSYNYVNSDVYGADDLDSYGHWVPSQYGQVWAPQPSTPDWSPYSNGQWSWVDYYGWTWVDYAPWGWAPYHYGRWFFNGSYGWCWWPGARVGISLWSPALVGFFGWGGGGGIWAGLGWVALAPFEVFHGWWGHGLYARAGFGFHGGYGFGRGYAFARSVNVASMYRNAAFRGGAMTAAFGRFGGPGQRFSPATRAQLTNASLFHGGVPVSPARGAMQFTNRAAVANPRLASAGNRQFFRAPQGNMARSSAQPFASQHGVAPNMRTTTPHSGYAAPSSGGWQRFGAPGATGGFRQGLNNSQEQSGWHRFGAPQGSGSGTYGGARQQTTPPATGSYSGGYNGGRSASTAPRYSAPGNPAPQS